MKGLLFFGAFALLAFVSCKDIDVPYVPEDTPEETYDEAWYADNATISSSDSHFSFTEEGEGKISFKAEGGSVVVYVDCGTEWTADDSGAGVFGCEVQSASITVTADQNLAEEELYGTITLMTLPSQIHFATIAVTQNAYGAPEITVTANEWNIPAVAATAEELTTEIGVEATGEWEVECDAEWLTAEKGENSVSLTATENETFEERVATVVLTCTDGYNSDSETITVTQDARAYITLSVEEFEFDKKGGEAEVTVESNYEWSYAYESDWFSVSENTDGSLTITVDVNRTGNDREGAVVFTAGDGAANVAEATLTITQGIEDPDALILEYTIAQIAIEIELPIADVTYAEIDWGDGETETKSSNYPSHIYTYEGTYYVSISGTVGRLNSYSLNSSGRNCLTAVIQWGDLGLTSMQHAFYYCQNLTSLPDGPGPFENVTTFNTAFRGCTSLEKLPKGLFDNCTKVTSFEETFWYCKSLKELPAGLFKNCREVTTFEYCFADCSALVSAPSFEGLSKVTSFSNMFSHCSSLATLPEGLFDKCTEVTNFDYTFYDCTSLEKLPDGLFDNCINVTSFNSTFESCSALKEVPDGLFDNCINVTSFEWTFESCSALKEVPEDLFKNCTEVTEIHSVFYKCTSLVAAPSFEGLSKVTTFQSAFYGCTSLVTVSEDMFSGCTAVTNFTQAFYNCSSVSGESPYDEINVNGNTMKVHLYERADYPDYFTAPTGYSNCFKNSSFSDMDSIPSSWGGNGN